ncbi:hypothetical protein [Sporosarcina ureae]|uniref:Uncharacterized protein n=1 Tax=Sporosarcina ureae TaxID=1571 RepID=A0ABN4YSV1_SPOUR|nr:hypothetical protein [Sporosarcina ureae]ARF14901.1 hypothetical protein SporoS204_12505 [Sporosarcina ureae]
MESAINANAVTVTFSEVTEAIEDANVVVKDGEGNVVETKPMLLAEGTTQADFEFVTPFPVDHKFTGVWTVNNEKYNFDAINQLADIVDAAVTTPNQIKLQTALDAAGITYADELRIADYLGALQAEGATASLEAVQKAITKVDEDAAKEETNEAAVKAVVDAKTQAQLLKALTDSFDVVNPEWIVAYDAAIDFAAESDPTLESVESIQAAINGVNLDEVTPKVTAANMSLDSEKVAEARTFVTKWIPADEEDAAVPAKELVLDGLNLEDALIAVNNAKTNSALKSALTNLDTLENSLLEKYKDVVGFDKIDEFDIKTVEDANLTAYRDAIKDAEVGAKNQRKDIQKIVSDENIAAVGSAQTKVLEDLNAVTTKTAAADIVALLEKSQKLHEQTNKVNSAYAEAYKTALISAEDLDATEINTLIGTVNDAQDAANGLVDTKEELVSALAEANKTTGAKFKTITLEKSIEVDNATIKLTSGVTIEGNNHTLYVGGSDAGATTAEGIEVTAGSKDVVIKDLKVVGTHGDNLIEIYGSATLDNITTIGGKKVGIYVNNDGANTITVNFKDITTASNGWDAGVGIVSQQIGSKVIANFTGVNSFGEPVAVYTDDFIEYKGQYEINGLEKFEKKVIGNQYKWLTGNPAKTPAE